MAAASAGRYAFWASPCSVSAYRAQQLHPFRDAVAAREIWPWRLAPRPFHGAPGRFDDGALPVQVWAQNLTDCALREACVAIDR
eukprot:scaffold36849_cov79-Phaeocystis_antarctica.AAC.1